MSAIPGRYRGCDDDELPLAMLADVFDPPAPEQAAADPARWRAAVANVQAALDPLPTPTTPTRVQSGSAPSRMGDSTH
jgi:uncharacterized membrane protein